MLYVISTEDDFGKRSNEKGKLFENLMVQLLDKMGWKVTSKDRRIILAGIEVDIHAKNKIHSDLQIVAQCKAYKEPIKRNILSGFWGQLELELEKAKKEDLQIRGLFFSTSELNGSAKGYYKNSFLDFSGRENVLKVYSFDELVQTLEENDFLPMKVSQVGCKLPDTIKQYQPGDKRLC